MEQQLAAVRLRLDNLFIKQSIFGHPEPRAIATQGATPLTCDNWDDLAETAGTAEGLPALRGNWRGGVLPVIAAISRYGR
jgi:hypothetical protein